MMKKAIVSICMASVVLVLALSSCRSTKEIPTLSVISGEWNIIEINGAKVVLSAGQQNPFIGFDTATGKVYGSSGCNRIMGSFDVNLAPGTLDLGQMGSTRMMCPDMTLEQNVLGALAQVKGYKTMGKDLVALCNAKKRPVLVLQRKAADVTLAALTGSWTIAQVNGDAVQSQMDTKPFLKFDVANNKVHGNTGCNVVNGSIKGDDKNPRSLTFPPTMASTMMACPDLDLESTILKAMSEVVSFDQLPTGAMALHNAAGDVVLLLIKQ